MKSSLLNGNLQTIINDFKLEGMMMRYSQFVPRLFNYCLSLGMTAGKIMPSRELFALMKVRAFLLSY